MKNNNKKTSPIGKNKYPTTSSRDFSNGKQSSALTGIVIAEVVALGAAGFVLWKNREKIFNLLEKNGIEVPDVLSEDLSQIVERGVSYFSGGMNKTNARARMHDA